MKVLIISNLAPLNENLSAGIFIVKRLQQYKNYDIEYRAISIGFKDSADIFFLKKILRKRSFSFLEKFGDVEFEPVLIRRNLFKIFLQKIRLAYCGMFAKTVASQIQSHFNISEFDLIHAHGMYEIPAGEVAYLLAKKFNKPFVVTLHGSDVNIAMPKNKKRYVKVLERASKVIFVSKGLQGIAESFGYSAKNAVVIANGYDPKIFKPTNKELTRKKLAIDEKNAYYVGFVGNLVPIKRADRLAVIFKHIKKYLDNVKFVIVGEGLLKESLMKETQGMNILFTGILPQEQVAKFINAMDLLILPSRNEGFGAVCIESQACGTCVVGSNNGGIPEAIGFDKYVVEEGEDFEERMAEKVVEILQNGYDSEELIYRAKHFKWQKIVSKEKKIYQKVLKK